MRQVTKGEFFAALKADPRDIMPRITNRWCPEIGYRSEWRTQGGARSLFGVTESGTTSTPGNERHWLT